MMIKTSQCPQCEKRGKDKSRDNLVEYPDGFHCFSCGYHKHKHRLTRSNEFSEPKVCNGITLHKKLPTSALKWLLQYELTLDEMEGFRYADKMVKKGQEVDCNLLVLTNSNDYWLARNLDNDGVRYLSSGNKPFLKYGNNNDVVIFVEDIISAVKLGRVVTAVPMLGARVLREWWKNVTPYDRVIIWGDKDKAIDNVKLARRASEILGRKVEYIITDKDPKCYSTQDIYKYLQFN
jgi:Zn ribbon nucleic-acid-binding protein